VEIDYYKILKEIKESAMPDKFAAEKYVSKR